MTWSDWLRPVLPTLPDMNSFWALVARVKKGRWRYQLQYFDQRWFLPLVARLPLRLVYVLANWRGAFNAYFSRDWAELAVGFPYVGERSANAFREIVPLASESEIRRLVIQRYRTASREDADAWLAIRGRLDEIKMYLEPIRAALAKRVPGRGLVVVMSHYDNLFLGLVGIVRCGEAVYLMTSDIVLDPRVHPTVRDFFTVKYKRYEEQMGGGELLSTGAHARASFYEVLREGGIVAVVSETPAGQASDKGTWVHWLGKRRKMADSALRMAIDTNSQIIGMRNFHTKPGHIAWEWSEMLDPTVHLDPSQQQVREQIYGQIFSFLEAGIRRDPGRWWAAHLLEDFVVAQDGEYISKPNNSS